MAVAKILEAAARRKCPECKGKGGFGAPGWEDDPDEYYGDCRYCEGTGLWLPMLSNPCGGMFDEIGGMQLVDVHDESCCSGSRRSLNIDDPEALDAAAEKLGYTSSLSYFDQQRTYLHVYQEPGHSEIGRQGESRKKARKAAFAGVVKAVWPEVEGAPTD